MEHRKIWVGMLLCLLLLCFSEIAWAGEKEEIADHLLQQLDITQVNKFVEKMNREIGTEMLPTLDRETIPKLLSGGFSFNLANLGKSLLQFFFKEVAADFQLLGKLLFLAVLCALLQNLQSSFESGTVGTLAYSVCFLFLAVIALGSFHIAVQAGKSAIQNMADFMTALLPLMLSLLAGVGALTSAALFQPVMLFTVNAVSIGVKNFIFPIMYLAAILEIVGQIADRYRVSNLTGLLKQISMFTLGLSLTIFLGVIAVQGVTGGMSDGISLRVAKFATGTFIPVVGKMFSDAVELVMGLSLLLKNVIGLFGAMLIVGLCVYPGIKILSLVFIFKIAGILVQPVGDDRMAKCLDGMGNNLMLVFGAVATVALMFFLSITMMIGAGSVAVMLR
jgi:stage III sporulation protein AE